MSTPSATVTLYDVYDLTPDYVHTRWFDDNDARDTYFDGTKAVELTLAQHIRVDSGKVKLPWNIKDLHTYSYMSIQNVGEVTGGDDHRYYCFVTDMEYVSDACTVIYFKVDVIQTYLHSINLWKAYVERCHNDTDNFGDNIIAEPFNPSDYFVMTEWKDDYLEDMYLVLGISSANDVVVEIGGGTFTFDCTPQKYNKDVFTSVHYFKFSLAGIESDGLFLALLKKMADENRIQEIVDMYICPKVCIPDYTSSNVSIATTESTTYEESPVIWYNGVNASSDPNYNTLDGYEPKNKKMFTYPFNYLQVSNGEGDIKKYLFEYFNSEDNPNFRPKFQFEGSFIGEPSVNIYVKDYKRKTSTIRKSTGGTQTVHYNYDNCISLTGYPHCAFNADAYALYQGQNKTANTLKAIGATIVGALVGFVTMGGGSLVVGSAMGAISGAASSSIAGGVGAAVGATVSGAKANINNIASQLQAYNSPDVTLGNQSGTNAPIEHGHKNFIFSRVCCNKQYAEVVDNYFTMFGYAQNKIMDVKQYLQRKTRPYWKYIKCTNFTVHGAIENKYKTQIAQIFNSGITFWYNEDVPIGAYNYTNDPVTPSNT